MDHEKLLKFIKDSRFCSETEKCAVACATRDLAVASWCDTLHETWAYLDEEQRIAVNQYRKGAVWHSWVQLEGAVDRNQIENPTRETDKNFTVATNNAPNGHKEPNTTMQVLSIPYSDDLLVSTGKSKDALEQELRFLLAAKLFELRRLSLGQAAQLYSMPKVYFMEEMGRMGMLVINFDNDQIQDELNNA